MKLYAPSYYKKFRCIADKCEHSCCVGWEIDIDSDTLKKYENLKGGYGDVIESSISTDGTPHFKLCENDRCPHLNDRGLCNIIIHMGENCLCRICREHPRFYNFTMDAEVGIGMSCPEAARIILSSPDFSVTEEIGELEAEDDGVDFDGIAERSRIYRLLCDTSLTYEAALDRIRLDYSITELDESRRLEVIDSLEYLDPDHQSIFQKCSSKLRPSDSESNEYLKRFLAYLIYRHCTEAVSGDDFSARLAFCLFCESLFASLICLRRATSLRDVASLAVIISEEIEYSDDNTFAIMNMTDPCVG